MIQRGVYRSCSALSNCEEHDFYDNSGLHDSSTVVGECASPYFLLIISGVQTEEVGAANKVFQCGRI